MRNVVIGFVGVALDAGRKRRWKPTVSLLQHADFPVDRLELLHQPRFEAFAHSLSRELAATRPGTEIRLVPMEIEDPWDFQEVYGALFDFARAYGFDEERERYHLHLTTGTHVAQICLFLLAESRHVPAKLVQTGPPRGEEEPPTLDVIDLDLSRYNALQQRFDVLSREYGDLLRGGIETRDPAFNALVDRIEQVASVSDAPILLLGESGAGKTRLAKRIYELKLQMRRVKGRLVHLNCAALRGPNALPTLFGQRRSHTGIAGSERDGLLREADGGVLFLDEVDELGLEEQALLLHAVETGRYLPLGSDYEVTSRFQVIAAANRDLNALAAEGRFRSDLLSRLNLWSFTLPPLRARRADMEANLHHELARCEKTLGKRTGFNADAAEAYLRFAQDPGALWLGNFRDFIGSVERLCTLAPRGRVTRAMVEAEVEGLRLMWRDATPDPDMGLLLSVMGPRAAGLDLFDRVQLAGVIRACRAAPTLSAAGRALFAASRAQKARPNDADRLRKYLARFELSWDALQ